MEQWKTVTRNLEQDDYDILECKKCGKRVKILYEDWNMASAIKRKLKHTCLPRFRRIRSLFRKQTSRGLFE